MGPDDDAGWPRRTRIFLVLCEHCSEPAVVMQEDFELLGADTPSVLWPVKQRTLSAAIPPVLREELEEARACFKVKACRAAAVMVRRTLEGFCQDQGAPEGRTLALLH
jgi:hypothetical protein